MADRVEVSGSNTNPLLVDVGGGMGAVVAVAVSGCELHLVAGSLGASKLRSGYEVEEEEEEETESGVSDEGSVRRAKSRVGIRLPT